MNFKSIILLVKPKGEPRLCVMRESVIPINKNMIIVGMRLYISVEGVHNFI